MRLGPKLKLNSGTFSPRKLRPSLYLSADRGVYQDAAVQFTAADKSWLATNDSAPDLDPGADDFLVCLWMWADSLVFGSHVLVKGLTNTGFGALGYSINTYSGSQIRFGFGDGNSSLALTNVLSPPGSIATGKWHFIAIHADRDGDLRLLIDNIMAASADISDRTGDVAMPGSPFVIGTGKRSFAWTPEDGTFFDGRIDSLMFFKKADLSPHANDIIAWAYNNGSGRLCAEITDEQKAAWGAVSGWEFAEASGTRADSWGTNHLTEQLGEGVTEIARAPGIVRAIAANGDGVSYWQDQSTGGKHAAQITLAKRPTMVTSGINSRPVIRGDGVDDYLGVSELSLEGAFAISAVFQCAAEPSAITLLGKDANNYITLTDNTTVTVGIAGASQAFTVSAMGTDPHILTITRDADSAVNVYLDGTVSTTGAKTVAGTLALEQVLAHGSEYFAGDLAEVLVYDGARSANEMAYTHQLLADRYGITI